VKDAVQTHGGKDWAAISALIRGRTQKQCRNRWHNGLNPSIGRASARKGKWAEDEDNKLKAAVLTHGGKDWVAISSLVPCRTRSQCFRRRQDVLDPSIGQVSGRTG
jgi:protein involved in temperature-dependent protein secretion